MIEDWFIKDIKGLCRFLGISIPRKLIGKDGLEKIKILFKKGRKPKIYQKGSYVHKFIPFLDMPKLTAALKNELFVIQKAIGIKEKSTK